MPDFDALQDAAAVVAIEGKRHRDRWAGRKGSRTDGTRTVRDRRRDTARQNARQVKREIVTFVALENEAS